MARSEQDVEGLLADIRNANARPPAPRYGHPTDSNADNTCDCGAPKFPTTPRCPRCAYAKGHIDHPTMDNLLDQLAGNARPSSYGDAHCQCGRAKLTSTSHCKVCAIRIGVLDASVQPGEEPCPNCGDGKNPTFSYCTGCAVAAGYINNHGQVAIDCPTDDCTRCGNQKSAAYVLCSQCNRGITGYRHQDWTVGPNPVPIVRNHAPLTFTKRAADSHREPQAPAPVETKPCWRCNSPTPAAKRFCRDCLNAMGAPPDTYDSDFNDRAKYESRPEHMQGRG